MKRRAVWARPFRLYRSLRVHQPESSGLSVMSTTAAARVPSTSTARMATSAATRMTAATSATDVAATAGCVTSAAKAGSGARRGSSVAWPRISRSATRSTIARRAVTRPRGTATVRSSHDRLMHIKLRPRRSATEAIRVATRPTRTWGRAIPITAAVARRSTWRHFTARRRRERTEATPVFRRSYLTGPALRR